MKLPKIYTPLLRQIKKDKFKSIVVQKIPNTELGKTIT